MRIKIIFLLVASSCYAGQLEVSQTNLVSWISYRDNSQTKLVEKQKQLDTLNKQLIEAQKNINQKISVVQPNGKTIRKTDNWAQQKINDLALQVAVLSKEINQINQYLLYANSQVSIWSNIVTKLSTK